MQRTLFVIVFSLSLAAAERTALDRYVEKPDPKYQWKLVSQTSGDKWQASVIAMTSQQWLTEAEVDQPVWKHWLTIFRPSSVSSKTGFLFITGGENSNSSPPAQLDPRMAGIAVATQSIVAELRMVPNQPLVFTGNNGKATSEDASIAYTWDKFLKTGDEKWPLRLPMTKAAVRAMDTVTRFVATDEGGKSAVASFVVAGASKRGWTTWTTAAVDKRVVGIIPIVIDLLNIEPSFTHHWRTYGFWAPAINDYVEKDLMGWSGTPQYRALMKIEEPFEYRERLTMPKLIINASGDQYFLPDSSQFYFDPLQGEKHLRYVPNTDHSLGGSDVLESVTAFYSMLLRGEGRPKYSWKLNRDSIDIVCKDVPAEVKLWRAHNPANRDFRLLTIGRKYESTLVTLDAAGKATVKLAAPEKGYAAHFVELTYKTNGRPPLKVTSGVKVLPDTYPFPPPASRGSGK